MDLVLCSTPLQAIIAKAVLEDIGSETYDLIYSARNDGESHQLYFSRLRTKARNARYIAGVHAPTTSLRHLVRRLKIQFPFYHQHYSRVFLASYPSFLFRNIVRNNPHASIFTFDDGSANIFLNSSYHRPTRSWVTPTLEFILRVDSYAQFKKRISKHFSIYLGFPNIVEADRLMFVNPWTNLRRHDLPTADGEVSFFIGQPFLEVLHNGTLLPKHVQAVETWLDANPVDYYLTHPRELKPLRAARSLVCQSAIVAEERIFQLASGRRPKIYGWFSTVLFNINPSDADKYYLSIGNDEDEPGRIKLMEKAGCRVIRIGNDGR